MSTLLKLAAQALLRVRGYKPEHFADCEKLSNITGMEWEPGWYKTSTLGKELRYGAAVTNPAEASALVDALNKQLFGGKEQPFSRADQGRIICIYPGYLNSAVKSEATPESVQEAVRQVRTQGLKSLTQLAA